MAITTLRRLRLLSPLAVMILVTACGNTKTGSMYSDDSNLATATQLQVTNAAYFSSNGGVELMLAGEVPSGELSVVHLTFFDREGRPERVDTNDDGMPDSTAWDLPGSSYTNGQAFFVEIHMDPSWGNSVFRVGAQVIDSDGNESNTVYADLDSRPNLKLNDPCDPRGFDVCPDGSTCKSVPGDWQAHCIAASSK
jgi:hypothetical protein